MFFSGLLSSLLGWFIFRGLEESPYFQEQQRIKAAAKISTPVSPVATLFGGPYPTCSF
jgi:hypothetical protein